MDEAVSIFESRDRGSPLGRGAFPLLIARGLAEGSIGTLHLFS